MILFFDRCFGKRLPEALKLLKPPFDVRGYFDEYQEDHNGPAVPDDTWLSHAGEQGWTVVTLDDKWHTEAIHMQAIKEYGVGCFVLSGANDPNWIRAKLVLDKVSTILELAEAMPRPFLYRLDKSGKVIPKFVGESEPQASSEPVA